MAGSGDESASEDYFNNLSRQPTNQAGARRGSQDEVPKPKRIACVLCRKRKLKCDGNKPSCGTCVRLQHECSYDEVRRKSGPKRGYVKALEARLAQVETLLKTQDDQPPQKSRNVSIPSGNGMVPEYADVGVCRIDNPRSTYAAGDTNQQAMFDQSQFSGDMLGTMDNGDVPGEEAFPWEMIGLGLDEPLPNQEVVNELNQAYFEKIHPSLPMVHRPRYYAAMNLAPHMRPPVCLRYAMWCNSASVTDKFELLAEHFYQRARKYIQQDEMKGHGESMITIAHAQTWILLATYEFKLMYFPRAWMSSGRASRMTQMMGLHRVDGAGLDVKQCLAPPRDWTEKEERKRTFWMSFCIDRYSSIGTGWPMTIVEADITSTLPADEQSYELSKGGTTMKLDEALTPDGSPKLTSLGGVIVMACLFGRNLLHLHRPNPVDDDENLNGDFWKRHRQMDNVLLNIALALPDSLRLPTCLNDANAVYMNMSIHTSTICLHQAAIYKADKNRMPARISAESKVRCITAAAETASIMRTISHLDLSAMNPFISFCLYVAARVFVQYLKSRPKDTQIQTSLQFLLSAMHAVKRKNPLTESFLVQLDVDLEGAGLNDVQAMRTRPSVNLPKYPVRSEGCPVSQMGVGERTTPSYGDVNVSGYTETNGNVRPQQPNPPTYGNNNLPGFSNESSMGFLSGSMSSYELPSRHRSPGDSTQGSGMHQSPRSFNLGDMETSPDGSSGAQDRLTPSSSAQSYQNTSGQTSLSSRSPSNMQQQQDTLSPGRLAGPSLFDPNDAAFSTDFDMQNFSTDTSQQPQSFAQQASNWSGELGATGSGTGFTPGPSTGLTPGPGGMMNDMMTMSEAEWNQMMDTMNLNVDWHPNAVTDADISGMIDARKM